MHYYLPARPFFFFFFWGGVDEFSSVAQLCRLLATPWTAACQASLSITNLRELTQTHVHRVGDAIQPSHPLLFPSPPTFNLSQHQGLFQWVSSSHQVVKVLEFQHQSFQWLFRIDFLWEIDWFDLLAVQGTLKSLLQHHSSKASILRHSAFPGKRNAKMQNGCLRRPYK